MLMAPATERVTQLYNQIGWTMPPGTRAGAPDHLGLQMLALAHAQSTAQTGLANQLHAGHLALWTPLFIITFNRLQPSPFYATLAELTLNLLLDTLPADAVPAGDLFPELPPPPVFRGTGLDEFAPAAPQHDNLTPVPDADLAAPDAPPTEQELRLRDLVKHFLAPRDTGLYLTREDIAGLAQSLGLPKGVGDRYKMLESLLRQAGEYDLLPDLIKKMAQVVTEQTEVIDSWQSDYPAWQPYANAWQERLDKTHAKLNELNATISAEAAHLSAG
jgi:hypothetical protein